MQWFSANNSLWCTCSWLVSFPGHRKLFLVFIHCKCFPTSGTFYLSSSLCIRTDDPFILWQDIKICLHKLYCMIKSLKNIKYASRYFLKEKRRGGTTCVCYGVTQTDYWIMVEDNNHQAVWAWTAEKQRSIWCRIRTICLDSHSKCTFIRQNGKRIIEEVEGKH